MDLQKQTDQKLAEYKALVEGSDNTAKRLVGETDLVIMEQAEKHETELELYSDRLESLKRDHEGQVKKLEDYIAQLKKEYQDKLN